MRGIFKDSSVASQFLQFCLLCLFFLLLIGLCASSVEEVGFSRLARLRILICLQFFFLLFIFPLTLAFLWGDKPLDDLFLTRVPKFKIFFHLFLLMLFFIPFLNLLGALNASIVLPESLQGVEVLLRQWEEKATQQLEILFSVHSFEASLVNLFLVALLPAIGEELFFRATVQRIFLKLGGAVFAVWITAFLFSAAHFQFYGFLPRLLFGAFFGYLLLWSKSLWLPIFAHFVNNAVAVCFYSFSTNVDSSLNVDTIGTGSSLWLGCLWALMSFLAVFYLKRELGREQDSNSCS